MAIILQHKDCFVLQYRSKRRASEWKDYQLYSTLELAKTIYHNAVASGLNWWNNKQLRIIHRKLREETISLDDQ